MADQTKIEWTDATWNPLRGCTRVSEGCRGCYAENMAARFSDPGQWGHGLAERTPNGPRWTGNVVLNEAALLKPPHWKRPRKIFVTSISDPFHPAVTDDMLDRIFAVMALCPQHQFQLLTKRPERMREYLSRERWAMEDPIQSHIVAILTTRGHSWHEWHRINPAGGCDPLLPLPNLWLGTSVENQEAADERREPMRILADQGWFTWVSSEPRLGPITWDGWEFMKWLVSGGESGRNARPSHPDWFRDDRDWTEDHNIPWFFKQWGEWGDFTHAPHPHGIKGNPAVRILDGNGKPQGGGQLRNGYDWQGPGRAEMIRVGKSAAGNTLDGRTHLEFPEVEG